MYVGEGGSCRGTGFDINKCEQKTGLPSRLPSPYYALSNTTGLLALAGGLDHHGWDSSGTLLMRLQGLGGLCLVIIT